MRISLTILVLAWTLVVASPADAVPTLIGETVDFVYINFGTFGDGPLGVGGFGTTTVGSGIEFISGEGPDGNVQGDAFWPTRADVGSSSITFPPTENFQPVFGPTEFDVLILTFTGPTIHRRDSRAGSRRRQPVRPGCSPS